MYRVPPFMGFTDFTPTLPKLYFDTYSQEQRIHALCKLMHKCICYADMIGKELDIAVEDIDKLESEFEEFKASGFLDYYEQQLQDWINEHMADILSYSARMVWFGLTLDGHFAAYIPEGNAWDDIVFDTGYSYGTDTYGRLLLRWDVDDSDQSVNQRPEDWS